MGSLAYIIGIPLVLLLSWSDIKAGGSWLVGLRGKAATGRPAAIAALDSVIEYFETEGCPEGVAAARLCGPHFFHAHQSDVTA